MTRNINVKDDTFLAKNKSTKVPVAKLKASYDENSGSLFNKVLKRRKSRQSTETWCNVDFDYVGDSSAVNHLIKKRHDMGMPNN